ncbi:MAG TPA: histidine kinase [Bryobacteraceae bacterium]|nr:histidine kinase [Bryobacteraceae bacterium]
MLGYQFLYLASLITFTFGALTFTVLTLFYWRKRRQRRATTGGLVFPGFTLACASAFLINLALRVATPVSAESPWVTGLSLASVLVTGLLPPLLFHLIYAEERRDLPGLMIWRVLLAGFYAIGSMAALAQGLEDTELISTGWGDQLNLAPAVMLGIAGVLGLLAQGLSRRTPDSGQRRHRSWSRVLLCLTLLCGVVNLARPGPFVSLLADYLVLGFFCVTLYYKERLVFFDLLIKRGAFFALVLIGLTLAFVLGPGVFDRLPADWSRPWIGALLLTPFFLLGPWIYERLAKGIDRAWLRRRYSPEEAERQFVRDVQASLVEEDLRARASASLCDIFQTQVEVCFTASGAPPVEPDGGLLARMEQHGQSLGWLLLSTRPNMIPFLSDDRRLLQSVARTLGVVLENVRFREEQQRQEEREQQLRLLASRSELKALRAQINPHFLFNALNAIAGLIQDQPRLADETVEQLANVFRYTLRKSENEWVRLDEEVEFVTAYLRVEQARFGERLQVEFDVDPAAAAIPIPAMSIQPLIENAIKHGASAVDCRGLVKLRVALDGDLLCVEVFDNGPGFPLSFVLARPGNGQTAPGHGLRNIIERLRGYYGKSAQLRWESAAGHTRVYFRIPRQPVAGVTGSKLP